VIYSVFDRVTADRQTHVWQHQLNNALQQLAWMPIDTMSRFNYFIITSTPLCVSFRWQLLCKTYCCTAPHSGWLYFACLLHLQLQRWLARLSRNNGTSYVSMKLAMQFGKVVSHHNIGWAPWSSRPPSNFVFKLAMLPVETLSCFAVKTAWSCWQLFCQRETIDRQTASYDYSGTLQCNCNVPQKILST